MIRRQRLVLMDPSLWEDKNDSELMLEYKRQKKVKKLFAICFCCGGETIHHWNAFSGANGCCIEFDRELLIRRLHKLPGVRYDDVTYKEIEDIDPNRIETRCIPFTKRWPYKCEKEFRIIWEGNTNQACHEIPIDYDMIRKITISQKVQGSVFATIRDYLRDVLCRPSITINHSTIYRNRKWIDKFKRA